ncbi:hypothetical protein FRB97_007647 [Tulasnella sp. 331]|nr:hypothetical protein FRB97_007647 [Tulasnella sp. 331]
MGASCPNLTDLTLAGQGIGADSIAIAAQTIGQLRLLRTVYLSSFNNEDVTAILLKMAELPALESLSLNRLIDFPSYWPQAIASPFPELKKLLVKWPSDPGTGAFLHNLTSTRSHLIELELGEDLNGYIIDLGEKMTLAGEHKELESIVMYSKQDTAPLSLETLQPILECRSLTTLKLELGGDVGMTDDDMGTMASSLTKLKYLTFLSNKKEPSSCLTLRALSIAVALCPYLENLSVEVDACNTGFPVNEVHVAPHKRLRELDFGRSQVSTEADNLAYFIAGLSDAKGFGIFYPRRTKLTSRWNAVNGALPAMQMKRAADRDSQTFLPAHITALMSSALPNQSTRYDVVADLTWKEYTSRPLPGILLADETPAVMYAEKCSPRLDAGLYATNIKRIKRISHTQLHHVLDNVNSGAHSNLSLAGQNGVLPVMSSTSLLDIKFGRPPVGPIVGQSSLVVGEAIINTILPALDYNARIFSYIKNGSNVDYDINRACLNPNLAPNEVAETIHHTCGGREWRRVPVFSGEQSQWMEGTMNSLWSKKPLGEVLSETRWQALTGLDTISGRGHTAVTFSPIEALDTTEPGAMIAPSRTTPSILQLTMQAMIDAMEYAAVVELQADQLPETVFTQDDHGVFVLAFPRFRIVHTPPTLQDVTKATHLEVVLTLPPRVDSLRSFHRSATGPLASAISGEADVESDMDVEGEETVEDDSSSSEPNPEGEAFFGDDDAEEVLSAGVSLVENGKQDGEDALEVAGILPSVESDDGLDAERETYWPDGEDVEGGGETAYPGHSVFGVLDDIDSLDGEGVEEEEGIEAEGASSPEAANVAVQSLQDQDNDLSAPMIASHEEQEVAGLAVNPGALPIGQLLSLFDAVAPMLLMAPPATLEGGPSDAHKILSFAPTAISSLPMGYTGLNAGYSGSVPGYNPGCDTGSTSGSPWTSSGMSHTADPIARMEAYFYQSPKAPSAYRDVAYYGTLAHTKSLVNIVRKYKSSPLKSSPLANPNNRYDAIDDAGIEDHPDNRDKDDVEGDDSPVAGLNVGPDSSKLLDGDATSLSGEGSGSASQQSGNDAVMSNQDGIRHDTECGTELVHASHQASDAAGSLIIDDADIVLVAAADVMDIEATEALPPVILGLVSSIDTTYLTRTIGPVDPSGTSPPVSNHAPMEVEVDEPPPIASGAEHTGAIPAERFEPAGGDIAEAPVSARVIVVPRKGSEKENWNPRIVRCSPSRPSEPSGGKRWRSEDPDDDRSTPVVRSSFVADRPPVVRHRTTSAPGPTIGASRASLAVAQHDRSLLFDRHLPLLHIPATGTSYRTASTVVKANGGDVVDMADTPSPAKKSRTEAPSQFVAGLSGTSSTGPATHSSGAGSAVSLATGSSTSTAVRSSCATASLPAPGSGKLRSVSPTTPVARPARRVTETFAERQARLATPLTTQRTPVEKNAAKQISASSKATGTKGKVTSGAAKARREKDMAAMNAKKVAVAKSNVTEKRKMGLANEIGGYSILGKAENQGIDAQAEFSTANTVRMVTRSRAKGKGIACPSLPK